MISEYVLSYVFGAPTTYTLWTTLASHFSAISRSHVLQLKSRLQRIKKGTSTIPKYLQNIKAITNNLATIGSPIDDIDLVYHILHGLPTDYNEFITTICIRDPPVTADDLHGLSLSENCLWKKHVMAH